MRFKSLLHKLGGVVAALSLFPSLAHAFQMEYAHRLNYGMTPQAHWEAMWRETMWDIGIIGALYFGVAVFFMIAYRRKGHHEVGQSPKLSKQAVIGWVLIPCFLFLADDWFLFVKNVDLHNHYREVPPKARTITVTASMWNWNYDYGNGVDMDNELRVPVGKPVVLRMHSEDVVHSHYLAAYHVTEDAMPGRITYEWFYPDKIGKSVITCREYCGANHSRMFGHVIVMSQADFDAWMEKAKAEAKAEAGHRLASAAANKSVANTIN